LALLGMGIFALSGGGDFIWHELFGFEVDVEALLSPSHLALATGAVLFLSAPFRAAWQRTDPEDGEGWRALLPAVVALFIVFSVFTFMTQFSNPFSNPQLYTGFRPTANVYYSDVAGISYILTSAALMMFFLL
ncbi:MAG: hypothetical protein GTO53_08725, partial [Planctomycetales bacterium]|nr:hypothetical protein [Planctomycetales bacterium]